MARKLILFGAGRNGIKAINKYGRAKVAYLCDNDPNKVGKIIEGVEVISFSRMASIYGDMYLIMITPANSFAQSSLRGQLEAEGIFDYILFVDGKNTAFAFQNKGLDDTDNNVYLKKIVDELSELDFIDIIEPLRKNYRMMQEAGSRYFFDGRLSESGFYGNVQSLAEYANIPECDIAYSPCVSHYDCLPSYDAEFYNQAVIMSGEYHSDAIHKRYPYVPVFTIGPYIHYVKGFLSEDEISERKKELGKILLVYMPHSLENTKRNLNGRKFIDEVIERYGADFQTLLFCVYWADIFDDICKYAEARGMILVSSGFRFDWNFNRRQRSLLELADAVVCGDIGTFVSYSICMNKPVARIDTPGLQLNTYFEWKNSIDKGIRLNNYLKSFENGFVDAFNESFSDNAKGRKWMEPIAGFSKLRDGEYIRDVFSISKDIWLQCGGALRFYQSAVRHVYYQYIESGEFDKIKILQEAVTARLD